MKLQIELTTGDVKTSLNTMNTEDLQSTLEHASDLLQQRGSKFLKLPPELRNRIYRLSIIPDVIEAHVERGRAPALLKVSQQISSEFKGLYYSPESLTVELFDTETRCWELVKHSDVFRAILARVGTCGVISMK